jgi:sulfide:quinone oxidoreductase
MTAAPEIVVVGAGVAALELVLALRELAGDSLRVTLVAPETDFVLRPMLVAEPLGAGEGQRVPLSQIAADVGCRLVAASVVSVDPARRRVVLRSGDTLPYDTLVLAPGVRTIPAYDDVIALGDEHGATQLRALRQEIRNGLVHSLAFVAPTSTGWLLPLYEAALITANGGDPVGVTLITPERRPLELFGASGSAAVARALQVAGIDFVGGQQAVVADGSVLLRGHARGSVSADRIVSLPLVRGLRIPGVPAVGVFGLIPVDSYGRVDGMAGVYAAGDATDFPIKQGAIACDQADVIAANIAARHGAAVTPSPFRPILRAMLLTGDGAPIRLGAASEGPDLSKRPGQLLAPYLTAHANAPQRAAV